MDASKHIDAIEVHGILTDCLFRDEELKDGRPVIEPVAAEGIMHKVGFHPGRLKTHTQRIAEILHALPAGFQQDGGGGMSFLNACEDANGDQWGQHSNMDELFMLGLAAGHCKLCVPREMWSILPGGMPYYVVTAPSPVPA